MNCDHADSHYSTVAVEHNSKGMAGLELHRTRQGQQDRVAQILFWDASGQFFITSFNCEVPLGVLEELIGEAKATVKTK